MSTGAGSENRTLVIGCGALVREITEIIGRNGLAIDVEYLPSKLHNRPEQIPEAIEARIVRGKERYSSVFVAYADCGTGGRLDAVLERHDIHRLEGAHCYEFFAGAAGFAELADAEPGTFYLTDFLARHFERLVWHGLGLDEHPELMDAYFGNYTRLLYLSQTDSPLLRRQAEAAADRLRLRFEHRHVGHGELEPALVALTPRSRTIAS